MTPEMLERFSAWLEEAAKHPEISEPTAMALATATPGALPSVRIVLLKGHNAKGFVFYTNEQSRKGDELHANPHAALCFYWMPLDRQVRIEGRIEEVTAAEADAYFASRSRNSRMGAWASEQSRPLESRDVLELRLAHEAKRFEGADIPRPPHWKGFRIIPSQVEFWQEAPHRLHDRDVYRLEGKEWKKGKLFP